MSPWLAARRARRDQQAFNRQQTPSGSQDVPICSCDRLTAQCTTTGIQHANRRRLRVPRPFWL
eukprot:3801269-Prymnesium_polylepis.1